MEFTTQQFFLLGLSGREIKELNEMTRHYSISTATPSLWFSCHIDPLW